MGWIIFAFVLLLLLCGASLWIRIIVSCNAESGFAVFLRILFFKIPLYPSKEKKVNTKKFSIRKFRKMRRREEAKLRKKKAKQPAKKSEGKPKKKLSETVSGILDLIKNVVLKTIKKFGKHLRIEVLKLHIKIASDDAAKTAILYGTISQSVAYILEILSRVVRTKKPSESVIVQPDFVAQKSAADILIVFKLRTWHIFSVALTAAMSYITNSSNSSKK